MLTLAPDLKRAIRDRGLKGSQSLALQQLSPKNLKVGEREALTIRASATKRVIEEKLSVAQTRKLVKQIKQGQGTSPLEQAAPPLAKVTRGVQQLSTQVLRELKTSQLEELQQLLGQKLAEISEVLQQR